MKADNLPPFLAFRRAVRDTAESYGVTTQAVHLLLCCYEVERRRSVGVYTTKQVGEVWRALGYSANVRNRSKVHKGLRDGGFVVNALPISTSYSTPYNLTALGISLIHSVLRRCQLRGEEFEKIFSQY